MAGVQKAVKGLKRNRSLPARQNTANSKGNACVEENASREGDGEHMEAEHCGYETQQLMEVVIFSPAMPC